jgi:Zn-dependent M28 family amino/carboxypeptidase
MIRSGTMLRRVAVLSGAALVASGMSLLPANAAPRGQACEVRNNNTIDKLLECVTAAGAMEHLEAFQEIADENGGNRAAGTAGYEASVDYVVEVLEASGWTVTIDEFDYTFVGPSTLQQLTPISATYETGAYTGTGYGEVTAAVTPVDLQLGLGNTSTSGCEAADFAGFPAGNIALVQRGTCPFGDKAINAAAAGAAGVVIFNQGNTPAEDRNNLIVGTLGAPDVVAIPVVGASYEQGVALSQAGSTATVAVPQPEERPQKNVIAEKTGRNDGNVVMAGAHLDSVQRGPGINDNGSGSAALLELAENLGKLKPQNTIRLAWWGAEEDGLLGAEAYVAELSEAERNRIALYLNFDMVASPNYVFFVYDGDDSDAVGAGPGPDGSAHIEETFEAFYESVGEPYKGTDFSGRSDYGPFIAVGIPSGGLFTGAEGVKSAEEAEIWGGTAGISYDPCYHQACDTIDNVDEHALDVNSDAIALSVLRYSYSTEDVNGVPGVQVPGGLRLPVPSGPAGGSGADAGGHDHGHDHGPTATS